MISILPHTQVYIKSRTLTSTNLIVYTHLCSNLFEVCLRKITLLFDMCHRQQTQYRCNHRYYLGGIHFCPSAGKPKAPGGRTTMCHEVRKTTVEASSDICGRVNCTLSKLGGKWECCKCKENGNRFLLCDNGNCNHPVCQSCSSAS